MLAAIAIVVLICAWIPAVMFLINLRAYAPPPPLSNRRLPAVSILIPARDEAHAIEDAVHAALASRGVDLEVIVMDDGSTDGTDALVQAIAAHDPRLRLERATRLPGGWNGKQHACWALAHVARNPVLCFVDADVRLKPDCVARMAQLLDFGKASLVSGFPRQITGTLLEWMLLPLIHFVLLGFLPIAKMRKSTLPGFAAGCGQFMMVRAEAYFVCGGHSNIKLTMHDGLRLPRLFRDAGLRTDLADLTGLATCRMYRSASQVWSGLAKNATEGLAAPSRIVPISLLLFLGQVGPFVLLGWVISGLLFTSLLGLQVEGQGAVLVRVLTVMALASVFAAWLPRLLGVGRFRQDWRGAVLHPLGIVLLLAVQWYALWRKLRGGAVRWKDRAYAGGD
jgi:glycosyltransferase involved in cell wall biosynthesis